MSAAAPIFAFLASVVLATASNREQGQRGGAREPALYGRSIDDWLRFALDACMELETT